MLQSRNQYPKMSAPQSRQSPNFSPERLSKRREQCKENGYQPARSRAIYRRHHHRQTRMGRMRKLNRSEALCDQIIYARRGAVTESRAKAVVWGYSSYGTHNRGLELRGSQQERERDFSNRRLRAYGVLWRCGE